MAPSPGLLVCLGGLLLTHLVVVFLPLPRMPPDTGSLAQGETGNASSCPCHLIHGVAKVKGHPIYALVSSAVQMGIIIPFKTPHWTIVRIK